MATTRRGSGSSSSSGSGSGNTNWHHYPHQHHPPLNAPKIIHLPRRPRSRRNTTSTSTAATTKNTTVINQQVQPPVPKSPPPRPPREPDAEPCGGEGRLEALFERERPFTSERRARVGAEASCSTATTRSPGSSPSPSHSPGSYTCRRPAAPARSGDSEVEKWRFEAEVLRAECNFLRMEREVTGKKIQRSRERVDAVLRSAIEAVVSGRRKVEGNQRVEMALEELQSNLECLRKSMRISRHRGGSTSRDTTTTNNNNTQQHVGWGSCTRNFDKKALVLRRRLQEMNVREMMPKSRVQDGGAEEEEEDEEVCVREIREIASETTGGRSSRDEKPSTGAERDEDDGICKSKTPDVEALSRKMQIISMGMLERVEEYGSILSSSSCTSASGAATVGSSAKQARSDTLKAEKERTSCPQQQQQQQDESGGDVEGRAAARCSGVCKDVVARIVDQVRAETEQWTEMQAMLSQVREEMDDLRRTRDFWERRAAQSDHKIRSISAQVAELRQRAGAAERKAAELEDAAARYGDLLRAWGTAASAKPLGDGSGVDRGSSRAVDKPSSPCQMHKRIEKTGLLSRLLDENAGPAQRAAHANRRPPLREIHISQS